MKARTAVHLFVGSLVALALVFFASNIQAGSGSSIGEMISAQRHTPLLWIIDACAVAIIGASWWFAVMLDRFQEFSDHQAREHHEQLNGMIERTCELERVTDEYADNVERLEAELSRQARDLTDQIATLEAASDARRKVFAIEARRISEHAYRLHQSQLETNARQVEAITAALQSQKGEIQKLRQEMCELQQEAAPHLGLSLSSVGLAGAREERRTLPSSAVVHSTGANGAEGPRNANETGVELRPGNAMEATIDLQSIVALDPRDIQTIETASFAGQLLEGQKPEWLSEYGADLAQNHSLSSASEATA